MRCDVIVTVTVRDHPPVQMAFSLAGQMAEWMAPD